MYKRFMNSATQHPIYIELIEKLHPQDSEILKQILNRHEFDLAPAYGYFEKADFDQIVEKALNIFFKKTLTYNQVSLDGEDLRHSWTMTLNEFQKNYWGYKKHLEKPLSYREPQNLNLPLIPMNEIPKKDGKSLGWKDAFFYIWSVLQALIITKALILVYGNQLAKDDSIENRIIFGSVIIFSFGSLFFFAWLRRKNPK